MIFNALYDSFKQFQLALFGVGIRAAPSLDTIARVTI